MQPELVSHDLCPYVQRAAILLAEKGVAFRRIDIDLDDKPEWFRALSPLGKVPLLRTGRGVLFESAVILEYLDEVHGPRLHPEGAFERAQHRGWMEFGSAILGQVWILETTADAAAFERARAQLAAQFARVEAALVAGPFFGGARFGLVDAVYAPVFRYFDTFDAVADLGILEGLPKVAAWRRTLAARESVRRAVAPDYGARLRAFIAGKGGVMAGALRVAQAA